MHQRVTVSLYVVVIQDTVEKCLFLVHTYQMTGSFKANITQEIAVVPEDVLHRTFDKMERRVEVCLDTQGDHFQLMMQL